MKSQKNPLLIVGSLVLTLVLFCSFAVPVGAVGEKPAAEEPPAETGQSELWITDKEPVTDYAYSFAVIGDTQTLTADYPDTLSCIYDWLVENAEDKKIQFAFGLGDITYYSTGKEWALAKKEIRKLDGVIPYSLIRGNHDTPDTFVEAFPYPEYADRIAGSYNKTMLYTYQTFNVGKIKYLVMNLDTYPSNEILAWAGGVIEEHPDYNVIVVTHAYLNHDGNLFQGNVGGNDGDDIWENLVKNHENIVLVLSGHIPSDKIVVNHRVGVHGNTVTEMLVDPQVTDAKFGPGGYVAMLYFSEDGKTVQTEYYSTVKKAFFREDNQFSFEVNVIEAKANHLIVIAIVAAAVVLVAVPVILFRKKLFRGRDK